MSFTNDISPETVLRELAGCRQLRVWLDDDLEDRDAPTGWVQTTTVAQTVALLETGRVVELSLDNDLGGDEHGEGKQVVDFICEQQFLYGRLLWPADGLTLHTANANARDQMARAITRYGSVHMDVHRHHTSGGKPRFTFLPIAEQRRADEGERA